MKKEKCANKGEHLNYYQALSFRDDACLLMAKWVELCFTAYQTQRFSLHGKLNLYLW